MQSQRIALPTILLSILFGLSMLVLCGTSVIMGLTAVTTLFAKKSDAVTSMIIAASTGFLGMLLLAAAVISLQKSMGNVRVEENLRLPHAGWHAPAALLMALISIGAGSLVLGRPNLSTTLLPIFTITGITAPLWLFVYIAIRNLELGPRWRTWGIFGLGLTLGPLLITIIEVGVGAVLLTGIIMVIAMQPGMTEKLFEFYEQLQTVTNPEEMLDLFTPYALKPAVITIMLIFVSIAIPMMEELLKPIGVWLFAGQIRTPAMGFAMGILSGATYALLENFSMIAQAGTGWTMVITVRAGTGLLHIVNTGLMGWAITSLINEKRIRRFLLTCVGAVTLHGLWNGASMGLVIFSIAQELGKGYAWVAGVSMAVLAVLIPAFLVILIVFNHKLNAPAVEASTPVL